MNISTESGNGHISKIEGRKSLAWPLVQPNTAAAGFMQRNNIPAIKA